jgi:hypothetical protein
MLSTPVRQFHMLRDDVHSPKALAHESSSATYPKKIVVSKHGGNTRPRHLRKPFFPFSRTLESGRLGTSYRI